MKEAKKEDRPFVPLVFISFRLMVGIGCLFIFLALAGGYLWARKKLETTRWLYAILPLCIPLGFVATIAGWIVTEVGRQPWIIQGLMRTAQGATTSLPPEAIRGSLAAFGVTFLIIFCSLFNILGSHHTKRHERAYAIAAAGRIIMDYAIAWSILILVALFIYMALDGFDLGIGILFPLGSDSQSRENMMNSIAPIWDTNETWLVLAAGGLYGIFPKAYVFIFNALYIPLIAMLICLIFRGVSFEFRFKSPERFRWIWSTFFFLGSLGMSVFQGIIFGQLIQGFQTIDNQFNNDYWAWLNIFNFAVAGLVVLFYAFMGANFLIYRLKETERLRFVCVSKWLLGVTVLYFILVIAAFGYSVYSADATISFPSGKYLAQRFQAFYTAYIGVLVIVGLIVVKIYRSLSEKDVCRFCTIFIRSGFVSRRVWWGSLFGVGLI